MTKLDAKFEGTIRKAKDGSLVPDDEWCVFLAKDSIFALIALPQYLEACIELRCDQAQIDAVGRMLNRVIEWRLEHPDRCKYPDAWGERLLDQP